MNPPPLTASSDATHRVRVAVDYAIALGRSDELWRALRFHGIEATLDDLIAHADTVHAIAAEMRAEHDAEAIRARIAAHAAHMNQQESTT